MHKIDEIIDKGKAPTTPMAVDMGRISRLKQPSFTKRSVSNSNIKLSSRKLLSHAQNSMDSSKL